MPTDSATVDPQEPTIVLTRLIAAPPTLVWQALTNPSYLHRWWGPNGFTITTETFHFRVGGKWRFVMHGPDGVDYPNEKVFRAIEPERLIVSTHGDGQNVHAEQTIRLAPRADGKKTELTMTMRFDSLAARDAVIEKYHAVEGGQQTLARLADTLANAAPPEEPNALYMRRVLNAPRALVFAAWSRAEHLATWFAPSPLTVPRCRLELRTGGPFELVMRAPDGTEYPMNARFDEVRADELIVFSGQVHEGLSMHTTVTFADADGDPQRTLLTVQQVYSGESPAVAGAQMGWTATLDQLARAVDQLRGN